MTEDWRKIEEQLRVLFQRFNCPKCNNSIVSSDSKWWVYGHIPVIRINENGCLEGGYICPKDGEIIVIKDCSWGKGTRVLGGP